jgi:hypothetical protein
VSMWRLSETGCLEWIGLFDRGVAGCSVFLRIGGGDLDIGQHSVVHRHGPTVNRRGWSGSVANTKRSDIAPSSWIDASSSGANLYLLSGVDETFCLFVNPHPRINTNPQ